MTITEWHRSIKWTKRDCPIWEHVAREMSDNSFFFSLRQIQPKNVAWCTKQIPQNIMFLMDESVKWENNVCFMKKKLLTWVSDAEIIQTSLLFFFSQLTTCQTWTPFWSCTLWMMKSHLMRLFRISSSSGKRRSAIKPLFWWPTRRI